VHDENLWLHQHGLGSFQELIVVWNTELNAFDLKLHKTELSAYDLKYQRKFACKNPHSYIKLVHAKPRTCALARGHTHTVRVWVCVSVRLCVCVRAQVCAFVCVCARACTCIRAYVHTCLRACVRARVRAHASACEGHFKMMVHRNIDQHVVTGRPRAVEASPQSAASLP